MADFERNRVLSFDAIHQLIGDMFHNEVHYPEDDDPYYPEDHYFPATSERYGDDQYEIDIFGFVQI
ncbi:unnamed protein product [Brassica rapa subsp. trilocularis]